MEKNRSTSHEPLKFDAKEKKYCYSELNLLKTKVKKYLKQRIANSFIGPVASNLWPYLRDLGYLKIKFNPFLTNPYRQKYTGLYVDKFDWRAFRISKYGTSQQCESKKFWNKSLEYRPDIAFDIGANYGEFTVLAEKANIPVISIEPNPYVFSCLEMTFQGSKYVTLVSGAVGRNIEETNFYFLRNYSGGGSLSEDVVKKTKISPYIGKKVIKQNVALKSFKTMIDNANVENIKSILIKMDVEGAEKFIWDQFFNLELDLDWFIIIMEFNKRALKNSCVDIGSFWREIINYDGAIIQKSTFSSNIFSSKLPKIPPTENCDIIISKGVPAYPSV